MISLYCNAEITISADIMQLLKQQATVKDKGRIKERKQESIFKVNNNGTLSLICLNDEVTRLMMKFQQKINSVIQKSYSA